MTLTEFLLARIAEDELEARKWVHHAQQNDLIVRDPKYLGMFMPGWHQWRDIGAFAARVLAECEAKRRIVELHKPGPVVDHWELECTCGFEDHRVAECLGCLVPIHDEGEFERPVKPCPTLRLLALPYADHADYRQEWRP